MGKSSVNMSKKRPATNKNSAKTDTPTITKKLSDVEKFAERMRSKGITPPVDIADNCQMQTFYSDGKACGCVLNIDNSAIGFFGYLASDDDPFKWAIKAKDEFQASIAATIETKLRKCFNEAKNAFVKTAYDEDASDAVDEVVVEQIDQQDDESNETTDKQRDDTVVARLAALAEFEYDRNRKQEAKRLRIRVTTLDKAVANEKNLVNDLKIIGPRMLSDALEIVTSQDVNHISTTELISVLCADKNKSWSVFNRGDQINPKQLAHILSLYGVSPRDIRFNNLVLKGYIRESIVAAYSRYISLTAPSTQDDC